MHDSRRSMRHCLVRARQVMLLLVVVLMTATVQAQCWEQLRIDDPALNDIDMVSHPAAVWQHVEGDYPNLGVDPHSWWFRCRLTQPANADDPQVLWIRNGIYRALELYVEQNGRFIQHERGGSASTRSSFHDLFVLRSHDAQPLTLNPPLLTLNPPPLTLYVRLDSLGIVQLPAYVMPQSELLSAKERDDFVFGLFLGVMQIMQAYFLVLYFIVREKGVLYFVTHTMAATMLIVLWRGYDHAPWWPVLLQHHLLIAVAQLVVVCAIQQVIYFLRCRDAPTWDVRALVSLRNIAALLALLVFVLPMEVSIACIVITTLLIMLLFVLVLARYGNHKELTHRLFALSWIVFAPATLGMMSQRLGLFAMPLPLEMLCYGGWVVEVVLQAFALAVRVDLDQREKLGAQALLILAREREAQAQAQSLHHQQQARAATDEAALAQQRYAQELELRVAQRTADLEKIRQDLAEISITDALTGARNRRYFAERLDDEITRLGVTSPSLSLLLIDVDHFKRINDNFGHVAGDECLQQVAALMQAQLKRPSDVLCRYGGEEFAVLLPQTPLPGALAFANAIRSAVCAQPLRCAGNLISVSISVGLVVEQNANALTAEALLDRADRALYQAKQDGRNCVRVAT